MIFSKEQNTLFSCVNSLKYDSLPWFPLSFTQAIKKKKIVPKGDKKKVSITFPNILHSLCHMPLIPKVNQRAKRAINRSFLDGSQSVVRTTQPPPQPSPKCTESHRRKDACFLSSPLNTNQNPRSKAKAKPPWWQGFGLSAPAVRGVCQPLCTAAHE